MRGQLRWLTRRAFGFRIEVCGNSATDDIAKLQGCQRRQDPNDNRVSIEMAYETGRYGT
jgi:hypothetical protein